MGDGGEKPGASWVRAGPVDWISQDAPGYVIVQVGTGYEAQLEGRRIGAWVGTWDEAVALVAEHMGEK